MTSILKVDEIQNTDGKTGIVITPDGSLESVKFGVQTDSVQFPSGTFAVDLRFSGGGGSVSFSTNIFSYTKIYNVITFSGRMTLASLTRGTGFVQLHGLPFSGSTAGHQAITVGYARSFTTVTPISALVIPNTNHMELYGHSNNDARSSLDTLISADMITGTSDVVLSGIYFTNE